MSAAVAVLLIVGLGGYASGAADDREQQAEVIRADIVGRATMVNEGMVQELIDAWAEDGIRMAPNKSPIVGIDSLARATTASFDRFEFRNRVHDVQEVQVFGDWAFSWGYCSDERVPRAGGDTRPYYGKYLVILKRQPDGRWLKYIDATNDEPAPQ